MLWVGGNPVKDRGFEFRNADRDTWLRMERVEGGNWDLEWVGYDAENKAFRIIRRIEPSEGAELAGGTGAFVKLTPVAPGKRIAENQPPAAEDDLMLEMRSYDRKGEILFEVTPLTMKISPVQRFEMFGE
jgi:hypothetical protein